MSISFRGPITWLEGVVENRPFQALIRQTEVRAGLFGRSRKRVAHGSIARDSKGRVRYDYKIGRDVTAIAIVDPVLGKILTLDPRRELYFSSNIQYRLVEARFPEDLLQAEQHRLEGTDCRRLTRTLPDGSGVEAWIAVDLLVPLRERVVRGGVETLWELHELVRTSPDPSLFSIPRHYVRSDGDR
jgi:hypothetical protein